MKILLAVDGSDCSRAAVEEVARRPWPDGTQIRILSVIEPPPMSPMPDTWGLPADYFEKLQTAATGRADSAIETAAKILEQAGRTNLEISTRTVEGFPKVVIVKEAEDWPADLIVVGSHGYRGLARLWLGSVSHAVASHARCSVEIVRSRTAPD